MTLIFLLLSTWTVVVVAFASASTSQRDALIDLWRANLGAQWSGASGWLSNATHCSWQGVQCSADNNSVASLSLASFGLVALQLPATFGALSDLQALDASANAIAELQMDESIAQFASLQFLSLTDNALTAMPAAAIARLPSLQMLLLGANRIAAVSAASFGNRSLPMLTLLDLHENAIAHFDAAVLPLLPALATLSLSDNRVLTAFPFANHSSLAQLSLDGNRLASIDGVEWFAQLTALSVDSNALTRLPTRLPVNLTELHATNNKLSALDDAICACGALKVLDVANNDVAALPACLASLVDIYGLLLARNSLTALPDGLSALGKLDTLDVQGNRLRALPDDLLASRNSTSLTHLLLAENALVDFNVSGSFPRLVQLDISFNPLITRVPDGVDLAHMPVLLELDAQHCSIARLPPATTLASLAIVDLAGNRVASPPANASASAAADALCGPLAPRPALLCQLSIVRLSNNRLTDVPDLSCCAKLATLLVDGNRLDRLPPWVGALPALASFAAGALLTDAALVPLRALRRRLDLLDLSGNRLAFPPPFLFQIADQLLLAGNQIREIDFLAFPDFYFNGTRWIDLSNNQLRALPPFYTIASGPVKPLTLRTLFAHNNLISGRVPFIPVDTLTLSGNPLMRVPGDRLNSLPLAANAGSTFFQLLSLDEPHVFSGSALTCKTIYRDRQVVSVTGAPSDVWQVLATVPLALDASYFDYRHCRCRATYYGFVGTAGDASCVPCASAFLPFRAARCDDGGNTLLVHQQPRAAVRVRRARSTTPWSWWCGACTRAAPAARWWRSRRAAAIRLHAQRQRAGGAVAARSAPTR
jgi:Leucine-rich repeat (LRR) protein